MVVNLKRAFTLVELMVIVAVIGMLAALALPAFARSRTKALTARCVQNERTIYQAVVRYEVDTGRSLYSIRNSGPSIRNTLTTNSYVRLAKVLECPSSGDNNCQDYYLLYANSTTFSNVACAIKTTLHVLR